MKLSSETVIEASADRVWEIVGHQFARIGEWAAAISASHANPAAARGRAGCWAGLQGHAPQLPDHRGRRLLVSKQYGMLSPARSRTTRPRDLAGRLGGTQAVHPDRAAGAS